MRAELERILGSRGFQNAGRLSRLLRHVTEKTLAGEPEQLKEYAVGVEVFDRDPSYDPRVDSIVRVEAGRLRTRLDEYYAGDGAANDVRIALPKGGYVAQFGLATRRDSDPSAAPAASVAPAAPAAPDVETSKPSAVRLFARLMLLAGSVAIIAGVSLWLLAWRARPEPPSVAVLSFSEYAGNGPSPGVAAQLNDEVTSELARLGTVGVVSHTSVMQFAGTTKPLREIAAALDADFVMEAGVQPEPGGIRVVARLVNARTDRKVWVQDFHGKPDALADLSRRIAAGAAAAVLKIQPTR